MSKINCKCEICQKEFQKKLSQMKKTKQHFCSRDCYSISKKGYEPEHLKQSKGNKTKKDYFCKKCNKHLGNGWANTGGKKCCEDCNSNIVDWSEVTLKQLRDKYNINQFHAKLRQNSRSTYKKSDKPKKCCNCNYDKHYEVCHIKDINTFQESDTVPKVNHIDNLIALCPNCHWEFDNGLLNK